MSRLIDADALMPLFVEKACTMKDRHGVKLGDEWLLNYNDIKDVIDNAPTVDTYTEDDVHYAIKEGHEVGYGMAKAKFERPQGEWIVGQYMDCHSDILPKYTCPFCGEVAYRKYDFCHCGADMRKETTNE